MKHKALEELLLIVREPREELREILLYEWEQKWIHYTEKIQYVINKSALNLEETDYVWYKVAQDCAEDLMENNVVDTSTTNTSFKCGMWSLRSPYAKLKENSKNTKKSKRNSG